MNKYWPVIMWMYDVENVAGEPLILKYKPSRSHADTVRWCYSHEDAMCYGLSHIKEDQRARINLDAMPSFIVKVIRSKTKPDVTVSSTLRLFVQRINVNPEIDD